MKCHSIPKGIIERYRDRLPVSNKTPIISLQEGSTPLIRLNNIVKQLTIDCEIHVKYEGLNPTGSFKDRGMTLAVSKAVEEGSHAIICASTGNTSASAAAYAARAGIKAFVLIPEGKIALGKLAQAMIHGAQVLQIQGNFDQGLALVKSVAQRLPVTIVNSINPYRLQGQKTAAFEVVEQLGRVPDFHYLPVGNAGNISAYWLGYSEYFNDNAITKRPVMCGYQAEGAAPLVLHHTVKDPETIATAIRIGNPSAKDSAIQAQQQSGGWFKAVSDQKILQAQQLLANQEGIFCEPAAAASIAGLFLDVKAGLIPSGATIVCTLTGHGLKDPDIVIQAYKDKMTSVAAEVSAVESVLREQL